MFTEVWTGTSKEKGLLVLLVDPVVEAFDLFKTTAAIRIWWVGHVEPLEADREVVLAAVEEAQIV